jgi:hypothetical protein
MYADGEGLSVRASKQGQLSWVFSYRLGGRGSKLERLTLGRYPDLSLKAAREKGKVSSVVGWLDLDPKTELKKRLNLDSDSRMLSNTGW